MPKTRKAKCSPVTKKQTGTCYSRSSTSALASAWNQLYPKNPVKGEVIEFLQREMAQCHDKDERCFSANLLSPEEHKRAMKTEFAPDRPKEWDENPTTWLTSDEIIEFCKQFELLYPMKFLGPSPRDYFYKAKSSDSCYWPELCQFNLGEYLKKGITMFCVSFNVDKHNSDGSHWVSVFVNAANPIVEVYYFDSAGDGILPDIKRFTDMVAKQARDLGKDVHYDDNEKYDHQQGDTECGMYSLFFFATMLEHSVQHAARGLEDVLMAKVMNGGGETFFANRFKNEHAIIDDSTMKEYRDLYFNAKYE